MLSAEGEISANADPENELPNLGAAGTLAVQIGSLQLCSTVPKPIPFGPKALPPANAEPNISNGSAQAGDENNMPPTTATPAMLSKCQASRLDAADLARFIRASLRSRT